MKDQTPKIQTPKFTAPGARPRDLEERTAVFAMQVRTFVRLLSRTVSNLEDVRQLVRSSGSVAANCIEGNEALGDQDRIMRFRTCRKEAKESELWLRLIFIEEERVREIEERVALRQEAHELKLIFTTIIKKLEVGKSSL